jgi:hypothetical protein
MKRQLNEEEEVSLENASYMDIESLHREKEEDSLENTCT